MGKFVESPPYIPSSVTLTAAGIELVENPIELHRRFTDNPQEPNV